MSLEILSGPEVPLDPLLGRTVAVLGYGNQGHAHALNLRDSGVTVVVGARPDSRGAAAARDAGFEVRGLADAACDADLVILALPDEAHETVYPALAGVLRRGATLGFLHGFSIRFDLIRPAAQLGVVLVAPKGPGATLRQRFVAGGGLPCLFAVHQETEAGEAETLGLAWAAGIGAGRAGLVRTTFGEETETDLFGEQSVICGGLWGLMVAGFETLVEAGYPPELAYLECIHEVKQVVDLLYHDGPEAMLAQISNTAEFGAYHAAPRLVDPAVRARMQERLEAIRNGGFADEFHRDCADGFPWFEAQRAAVRSHPLIPAGQVILELMSRGLRTDAP